MSFQRRFNTEPVEAWPRIVTADRRGNRIISVDMNATPRKIEAAVVPERATRGEIPGQQTVQVYRLLVDPSVKDVDTWGRVRWRGIEWDIADPAVLHPGTRHTRHWTVYMQRRPFEGGGPVEGE